jgi:beta-xylosidase
VSEVGVSTFGAEEVQAGACAHRGAADRPRAAHPLVQPLRPAAAWEATTRHKEAEGSSYYRHFYMGLLREDGTPKPALEASRARAGRSASASGSISRITGSTMRSPG